MRGLLCTFASLMCLVATTSAFPNQRLLGTLGAYGGVGGFVPGVGVGGYNQVGVGAYNPAVVGGYNPAVVGGFIPGVGVGAYNQGVYQPVQCK